MIKKILTIILGILMVLGGIAHLLSPEAYAPMIPDFIPDQLANILAFVTEVATGLALIIPQYRKMGGLMFMVLMIAFLPLHVWDVFRENPAIGPFPAPVIRLVIQFLLIYIGWRIYRK